VQKLNLQDIYNLHKDMVYSLALHYTLCVEDAQEITQDVFLAAHLNLDILLNSQQFYIKSKVDAE
jgi:DNA-directed RNA polymerase specialized sigma24 family protein